MNKLCLLIKERHCSQFAAGFWFPGSSCIYVELHCFYLYLSAACCAPSRYGQLCALVWRMTMLFWQPELPEFWGSIFQIHLFHSWSSQANYIQAGCLQFGAMDKGKIFWLMCADVNGLSPSQLKYSCCLTNACPFCSSA